MHSKRPSIQTVVPLVLGLSTVTTLEPKSENALLIPYPDLSVADIILTFLDNFTSE